MITNDAFERKVSDWLHADAEHRIPDHLDAVLRRTSVERQRPAWSSLERWLPVDTTFAGRLTPAMRPAWPLLVAPAVGGVCRCGRCSSVRASDSRHPTDSADNVVDHSIRPSATSVSLP